MGCGFGVGEIGLGVTGRERLSAWVMNFFAPLSGGD
jgi:hypothetical protein